MKRVEINMTS